MKKRAAFLLIFPAFALLAGCTIPEGVKNAVFKTKDVVMTGVHYAVDAMDKFFEESKPEESKEEQKEQEEENTTEENTTTTPETGEGEGQEGSGEATDSEGI